jgi:hypothetical protein
LNWQTVEQALFSDPPLSQAGPVRQAYLALTQAATVSERSQALDRLLRAVRQDKLTGRFLRRLCESAEPDANRLALEVALRLAVPLDERLVEMLMPHLAKRPIPAVIRVRVCLNLLRSLAPTDERCVGVVESMRRGMSKSGGLRRFRRLREQLGPHPALDAVIADLEQALSHRCPRCQAQVNRVDLALHLWQEHGLVIDEGKIREPWALIDNWVKQFVRKGQAQQLEDALELAEQIDPIHGVSRVYRKLLANDPSDADALDYLRQQAKEQQATLCPRCYALVPTPQERQPTPLQLGRGRLQRGGYAVVVDESGLWTELILRLPGGLVYRGTEPLFTWSRRGAMIACVGALLLIAFHVALLVPAGQGWPLFPTLVILLLAVVAGLTVDYRYRNTPSTDERAIDYAWTMLLPQLHQPQFSPSDAQFLAALALASRGHGHPAWRAETLAALLTQTRQAVRMGQAGVGELAALVQLHLHDLHRQGQDPIVPLAAEVWAALSGQMPLDYAQAVLALGEAGWFDRGSKARLRVLLCAEAFAAKLEVPDLIELGRLLPNLGEILGKDDLDGLSRLRWLYSLQKSRPWQKVGPAASVFQLARYPTLSQQQLEAYPDLLLFQPMSDYADHQADPSPIIITMRGIAYRNELLTDPSEPIEIVPRGGRTGGFLLRFGRQEFAHSSPPVKLSRLLQAWVKYYFREFTPKIDRVLRWRNPAQLARLIAQKTIRCPECHLVFLKRPGEVGLLLSAEQARHLSQATDSPTPAQFQTIQDQ